MPFPGIGLDNLAKIIVYQIIYFWASVALSRGNAVWELNKTKNETFPGKKNVYSSLTFLGTLAGYIAWNLGT